MRTIGLIGGMSWQSSKLYYDRINSHVAERLGGAHSAQIIVNSLDFAPIAKPTSASCVHTSSFHVESTSHAAPVASVPSTRQPIRVSCGCRPVH